MAYSGLNEYIKTLDRSGELARIKTVVDPHLEITEITDRISKSGDGGKALLFENTNTGFPLLINALGSKKRINLALGVRDLREIGEEIQQLLGNIASPKETLFQKLAVLPAFSKIASWMPKRIRGKGKCQEVIMNPIDIGKLPVLTCWPFDGGPFITLPMVITKDPESGFRNIGMYRMQVFGPTTTGMHWHRHKTGARHFEKYKSLGEKMPVAVALGGDPAYIYAATAPLPENIDEFIFAGFLRKKRVETTKAITQDIEVPADADIVIEGYVDPQEDLVVEGPFGDHTGFYSLEDLYPKFHITCISHRKDAVYPATIVGIPPQEDAYVGMATERIFLSPIKMSIAPEIVDMVLPPEGVAHNLALVKIKNEYPGHAIKVANALWGAGQMMFNKIAVITGENSDLSDFIHLLQKTIHTFNPERDIYFGYGPLDVLDHASNEPAVGSKMCIDLTAMENVSKDQLKVEEPAKQEGVVPEIASVNLSLYEKNIPVAFFCTSGITYENRRSFLIRFLEITRLVPPKLAVLYDAHVPSDDISLLVWLCLSNIDPQRDCHIEKYNENAMLVVDASSKYQDNRFQRDWPNIVASSDETIEKVNIRWHEYDLGAYVASPSLKVKSLILSKGATFKKQT